MFNCQRNLVGNSYTCKKKLFTQNVFEIFQYFQNRDRLEGFPPPIPTSVRNDDMMTLERKQPDPKKECPSITEKGNSHA